MSDHAHPVDPGKVAMARAGGLPLPEANVMASLLTLLADPIRSQRATSPRRHLDPWKPAVGDLQRPDQCEHRSDGGNEGGDGTGSEHPGTILREEASGAVDDTGVVAFQHLLEQAHDGVFSLARHLAPQQALQQTEDRSDGEHSGEQAQHSEEGHLGGQAGQSVTAPSGMARARLIVTGVVGGVVAPAMS